MRRQHFRLKTAIGLSSALIISATGAFTQHRDAGEDSLTHILESSRAMQLPLGPLENKIREGRAKNRPASEIYSAVKTRQKFLLQIRDTRQGGFSHGYTKQLFDLEGSNPHGMNTVEHRVNTPPVKKLPQPQAHAKGMPEKEQNRIDASSGKKAASSGGRGDAAARQADRHLDKADEKAEKVMEKAAFRAEKRMEGIQKRIQKRTMKRYGNGN
ncbi:MAG: hypothetical protein JW913_09610 [Chitinispirillaceae bacterium]|nr:hypothetical protein [Chitinispirillaceae bacterium]